MNTDPAIPPPSAEDIESMENPVVRIARVRALGAKDASLLLYQHWSAASLMEGYGDWREWSAADRAAYMEGYESVRGKSTPASEAALDTALDARLALWRTIL